MQICNETIVVILAICRWSYCFESLVYICMNVNMFCGNPSALVRLTKYSLDDVPGVEFSSYFLSNADRPGKILHCNRLFRLKKHLFRKFYVCLCFLFFFFPFHSFSKFCFLKTSFRDRTIFFVNLLGLLLVTLTKTVA